MLPTPTATEAVRRAVRAALLAETGLTLGRLGEPVVDPEDFLEAVGRHRVAQVLHPHAAALRLPATVTEPLSAMVQRERMAALSLAHELVQVLALLEDDGRRVLAFKGPCLALQTTGDLAGRGRGDVDLLVEVDDLVPAHRLLEAHGWQATSELPRPGRSWAWRHLLRTGYEVTLHPVPPRSSSVDVHWRLQPVGDRPGDLASVWSSHVEVEVAGRRVPTLAPADAFLHSCGHAAKDGWAVLRSLVDVHRLCRRDDVWEQPLVRSELWSLAATEASIGLPDTVPTEVLTRVRDLPAAPGRLARQAQDRAEFDPARFPVLNVASTLRRNARLARSPVEVARLVAGQAVPHYVVADLPDERASTAVPRAVLREAQRSPRRLREWREARG